MTLEVGRDLTYTFGSFANLKSLVSTRSLENWVWSEGAGRGGAETRGGGGEAGEKLAFDHGDQINFIFLHPR